MSGKLLKDIAEASPMSTKQEDKIRKSRKKKSGRELAEPDYAASTAILAERSRRRRSI